MSREQNIGKPIFAEVLRSEMGKRNVTQETVAQSANASQATVNGWLSGSIPRADALHRLAHDWGVTMEYLLTGEERTGGLLMESAPARLSPEVQRLASELAEKARALELALKKI